MNKELKPAKIILYILLIAPFFQVELLENLIPLMGKGYTLWQLLAGAAFVYVCSRDKVRIRDFSYFADTVGKLIVEQMKPCAV